MDLETIIHLIETDNLMKFYKSKEWRQLRLKAMKVDNYECRHCRERGKVTTRNTINKYGRPTKMEVNHIKPVKQFPHLALTLNNLEYLCIDCHNIADGKDKHLIKKEKAFYSPERW